MVGSKAFQASSADYSWNIFKCAWAAFERTLFLYQRKSRKAYTKAAHCHLHNELRSINVKWSVKFLSTSYWVSRKLELHTKFVKKSHFTTLRAKIILKANDFEFSRQKSILHWSEDGLKKGIDANYTSPAPKSIWAWFLKRSSFCSLRGPEN